MYMWVHGQWDNVNGVLLDVEQHIDTIKVFDSYSWGDDKAVPDISLGKIPRFGELNIDQKKKEKLMQRKICTIPMWERILRCKQRLHKRENE